MCIRDSDEAEKESIIIDELQLSRILGKPCIKTSATRKSGIDKLLNEIISKHESEKLPTKLFFSDAVSYTHLTLPTSDLV